MIRKERAVVSMFLTATFLCLGLEISASWGMASRPPLLGSPAPEFQLTSLTGAQGSLDQYRGKVVLLNFRATWCKPCTKEMPAMLQQPREQKYA